jgi:hypothetical protein
VKYLFTALVSLLLTSCGKTVEIVLHPIVYSIDTLGNVHSDPHAVVVVSTFGGIPYNIYDYAILPAWPNEEATNRSLRYPALRISVIHGTGGYHAFAISNDSLFGAETFRDGWKKRYLWPSGDSIRVSTPLEAITVQNLVEDFTQGPSNRHKFFSPEMRPLLLALRRRTCKLHATAVATERAEHWESAKKLLSVPDSCLLETPG